MNDRRRLRAILFACIFLSCGSLRPATTAAEPAPPAAQAPGTPLLEAKAEDYIISPGDILRINVWKEPDLTTEVFVRLDGRVTVPLLGDIMAAGRSPNQLASEIQTRLARFLELPPQVTVTVSQAVSARFFVVGEVVRAGAYPLQTRTTVLQALALAGGFGPFAKRERIVIIREHNGKTSAIRMNYSEIESGAGLDQNIALDAGDTILVP